MAARAKARSRGQSVPLAEMPFSHSIEFFDDPKAPRANSLVVAVTAVILDDAGNVLLQKRTDNELWGLPGGAMNIGESIAQAVVSEVKEETALDVEPIGLVGIYSDPAHVIAYADGEVRDEFSICFKARIIGGELAVADQESTEVRFVASSEFDQLPMGRSTRLRIQHFLEDRPAPFVPTAVLVRAAAARARAAPQVGPTATARFCKDAVSDGNIPRSARRVSDGFTASS